MLEGWHEFYALLGTAAAALVALLFVAVSIGTNVLQATPESRSHTRTFLSPVVFHYANVLFLSLIVLVPTQTLQSLGAIIGVAAAASAIYSLVIAKRLLGNHMADLPDRICYGAVPLFCYLSGLAVAALLLQGKPVGLDILAGSALLLLVTNIRNAWDLMMAFARANR